MLHRPSPLACTVQYYSTLTLSLDVPTLATDDSSRVVLSVPNTSGTDYINASFVDVSDACTVSAFGLVHKKTAVHAQTL